MNNIDTLTNLFIEFETVTLKRARIEINPEDTYYQKKEKISRAIKKLRDKKFNPYYKEYEFINFARCIRNLKSHNINKDYYTVTDKTIEKFNELLYETKHPYKVLEKATTNIYYKKINDKVLPTMREMNEKSYTHIPIYSNNKLTGIFSENSLFQYIMQNKKIIIDETTAFNDIKKCIDIEKSNEIVEFVSENILYDTVIKDFIKKFNDNQKLSCVMVTETGSKKEEVKGIITSWDIIGK